MADYPGYRRGTRDSLIESKRKGNDRAGHLLSCCTTAFLAECRNRPATTQNRQRLLLRRPRRRPSGQDVGRCRARDLGLRRSRAIRRFAAPKRDSVRVFPLNRSVAGPSGRVSRVGACTCKSKIILVPLLVVGVEEIGPEPVLALGAAQSVGDAIITYGGVVDCIETVWSTRSQ
jgi:hypothetical protein